MTNRKINKLGQPLHLRVGNSYRNYTHDALGISTSTYMPILYKFKTRAFYTGIDIHRVWQSLRRELAQRFR